MLKTGCGEFCIESDTTRLIFYKTNNKYYVDILSQGWKALEKTKEITKEEYLKKLNRFINLLKRSVGNNEENN